MTRTVFQSMRLMKAAAVIGLFVGLGTSAAQAAERLRGYAASTRAVTVSGVSSGGYMAVQFHVAHSARVDGAGIIAAGPYYCAGGSVFTALWNCMQPGGWTAVPEVESLAAITRALAAAGRIDATANLARSRIWLFSGTHDEIVHTEVVDALARYYRRFVAESAVAYVRTVPAGHAMVTQDYGAACDATATPFINDCDFDAAGGLLRHLTQSSATASREATGRLVRFDQREFAGGAPEALSMAGTGFAYVPAPCGSGGCAVHVVFHGCRQGVDAIGEAFVRHAGYNRWADALRLIVLYPQVAARSGWTGWPPVFVFNPRGCWDWWGYTGPDYHTRSAPQIRAVEAMIERLGSAR